MTITDLHHAAERQVADRLNGLRLGDRVRTASGFTPQEEGEVVGFGAFGSGVVVVDCGHRTSRAIADRLVMVARRLP